MLPFRPERARLIVPAAGHRPALGVSGEGNGYFKIQIDDRL
jgi:hypothetical protein